jgi:hypothetical protein
MTEKTNVTKEIAKLQKTVSVLQQEVHIISQGLLVDTSTGKTPWWHYRNLWYWFARGLGFFADLFSLIIPAATMYLIFSNFISVPPTHSLKINDQLTIPFVIENNSLVNLRDLNIEIKLINVQGDTDSIKNLQFHNSTFHINDFLSSLKANSSHTLLFSTQQIVSSKYIHITQADIQVNVYYKALFFTKEFNQQFRFIALPGQEGFYEYYPIQTKI